MVKSPNIQKLYDSYVKHTNDSNYEERYKGKEDYFHASGAGSCRRKLFFQSVACVEPTNEIKADSYRKMRLGTVFHSEMEDCFRYYSTSTNNKTSTSTNKNLSTNFKVYLEQEILIEELKVRGFYDLVLVLDTGEVYLYDFKTIGSYPYKLKFGRYAKKPTNFRYEMQLGTYGYSVKEQFGRIDGMFLIYYNKDDSRMKEVSVDLSYVSVAYSHWREVNDHLKQGLPRFEKGVSPAEGWECNYCVYKDICDKSL